MSKASQRKEAERQKRLRSGKALNSDVDTVLSRNAYLLYDNPAKYWALCGQIGPKLKSHTDDDRLSACIEFLKPALSAVMRSLMDDNSIAPSIAITFDFDDLLDPPDSPYETDLQATIDTAVETAISRVTVTSIWTIGKHGELTDSPLDWLLEEARQCDNEVLVWAFGIDHPTPFQLVLAVSQEGAKRAIANVSGTWVEIRPNAVKRVLDTHMSMVEDSDSVESLGIAKLRESLEIPEDEPWDPRMVILCNLVEAAQLQGAIATWALACQSIAQHRVSIDICRQLKVEHDRVVGSLEQCLERVNIAERRTKELEAELTRERLRVAHFVERPAIAEDSPSPGQPSQEKTKSPIGERMAAIFD